MTGHCSLRQTAIGPLFVRVDDAGAVVECGFGEPERTRDAVRDDSRCAAVFDQLEEYLRGARREFLLEVKPEGTRFQRMVWAALCEIPYGMTTTYGRLAARIGSPRAVRAVGRANGANPIAIIVPCHRVIGADGSLTGYGGGVELKRHLLELEGAGGAQGDAARLWRSPLGRADEPEQDHISR